MIINLTLFPHYDPSNFPELLPGLMPSERQATDLTEERENVSFIRKKRCSVYEPPFGESRGNLCESSLAR